MARKDDRVKIRELPGADVTSSDMLAIGKDAAVSGEKTTKATVGDVVHSSLDAGDGITITRTQRRGTQISADGAMDAINALTKRVQDLESNPKQPVHVSATPPAHASNENGDLWWDTNNARMYLFYGKPGQQGVWIQTNPTNQSSTPYDDAALKKRLDEVEASAGSGGSVGPRSLKSVNTIYQASEDAIIYASYHYGSHWPILRGYAHSNRANVQNRTDSAFIGWQGVDDDGGGQGTLTWVVRKGEYWQAYINGSFTNFKCWYQPLNSGTGSTGTSTASAGPNSITASATLNLVNASGSASGFGGSSGATIDANNGFSSITRPSRGKYVFTFDSPRATDTGYQVIATRFHHHPLEGSVVVSEMNKNGFTLLSVNDNSAITDPKGMYVIVVG